MTDYNDLRMNLVNSDSCITFSAPDPLLEIRQDGFFVRGEKIEQDEQEARRVYDAFILWMTASGAFDTEGEK